MRCVFAECHSTSGTLVYIFIRAGMQNHTQNYLSITKTFNLFLDGSKSKQNIVSDLTLREYYSCSCTAAHAAKTPNGKLISPAVCASFLVTRSNSSDGAGCHRSFLSYDDNTKAHSKETLRLSYF